MRLFLLTMGFLMGGFAINAAANEPTSVIRLNNPEPTPASISAATDMRYSATAELLQKRVDELGQGRVAPFNPDPAAASARPAMPAVVASQPTQDSGAKPPTPGPVPVYRTLQQAHAAGIDPLAPDTPRAASGVSVKPTQSLAPAFDWTKPGDYARYLQSLASAWRLPGEKKLSYLAGAVVLLLGGGLAYRLRRK